MALRFPYPLRQTWLSTLTERALHPTLVRAVRAGTAEAIEAILTRPHPGVVELDVFSPEYLEALLRELSAFEHWCRHRGATPTRPNTMNNHGVVLSELGLEPAMDDLVYSWLAPITKHVFPEHAGESLDHQHAFVVEYAEGGDTDLGFHVDDSEVTLNACLGLAFEGAEVYFRGARCDAHRQAPPEDGESWQWQPAPGRAILHAGAHRHGVHPLRSGRRVNLIVWARSSRLRRSRPAGPFRWCRGCEAA